MTAMLMVAVKANMTESNDSHSSEAAPHGQGITAPVRGSRITGQVLRQSLYLTSLAWFFGAFWMGATSGVAPTRLAQYLGADDTVLGWLGSVAYVAVLLQIPGSLAVDWLGRRKKWFIYSVTLHRALYMLIGVLPWIFHQNYYLASWLMVGVLLISLGLNHLGTPAWVNWMADLVPVRVRGKYFAYRSRLGIGVMMVTVMALGGGLDWFSRLYPQTQGEAGKPIADYLVGTPIAGLPPLIFVVSIIFMVAGAVGMVDILLFCKVKEPPMVLRERISLGQKLIVPLRDRQFMGYCRYYAMWSFAVGLTVPYWMKYILDFTDQLLGAGYSAWWLSWRYLFCCFLVQASFQLGQFIGYPMWGRAVDRFGRKPVLFISSMLHTTSWLLWVFLSPGIIVWMMFSQVLAGTLAAGQDVAHFNMMLQFNRKGGPGYQALGSVIFSSAGALGCFASAYLLKPINWMIAVNHWQISQYAVIIALAMACKYLADLVFLRKVEDHLAKSRRHTIRYIFEDMQGSLSSLIYTTLVALPLEARNQLRSWRQGGGSELPPDDPPSTGDKKAD